MDAKWAKIGYNSDMTTETRVAPNPAIREHYEYLLTKQALTIDFLVRYYDELMVRQNHSSDVLEVTEIDYAKIALDKLIKRRQDLLHQYYNNIHALGYHVYAN